MKVLGIIPARFHSSRFPGKPLALIGNKPMLRHVYDNTKESGLFEKLVIATDHEGIRENAETWNAEVIMTSPDHPSGTDRCAEVTTIIDEEFDIVVNIQGDEPFIHRKPLEQLIRIFENIPSAGIATLVHRIGHDEDIEDPNTAKVIITASKNNSPNHRALYFSRSPIPYIRNRSGENLHEEYPFMKHIGLYAYRPETLREIVTLPVSKLEKAESLEQLRWLENGYDIWVAETDYQMLSVDTQYDLEKAEKFYNTRVP